MTIETEQRPVGDCRGKKGKNGYHEPATVYVCVCACARERLTRAQETITIIFNIYPLTPPTTHVV